MPATPKVVCLYPKQVCRCKKLWESKKTCAIVAAMKGNVTLMVLVLASMATAQAQQQELPAIGEFGNETAGNYQVLTQSGNQLGWQVNGFMNEMLKQYSRFFSNWSLKEGARVVVFDNVNDFRSYSAAATGMTHASLMGYCHLKTDEDGNTFYELVTFEHPGIWRTLAHEGFHQFLGYELGLQVPTWLNEGMAQYFETSYVQNGRLQVGLISKAKLRAAQYLIATGRAPSLGELIQMDRATFYANARTTYPMSWALVDYLVNRDGASYRNSSFRRYLQDLKLNRNDIASFQRRFGRDIGQWQREFEHYILQLEPQVE
jgi:hypothetical protein